MKIIVDYYKEGIEDHAKRVISAMEKVDKQRPERSIPKGVAFHTTLYPQTCDDCNKTYWSKDQYGYHIDCKKSEDKARLGF